jgi:hypothetical protein
MNTYSNRRVANHLHGLIFELKERMNSRQDRPVMQFFFFVILKIEKKSKTKKTKKLFFACIFFSNFVSKIVNTANIGRLAFCC